MNERIKELAEQATSTITVNHEGYMGRSYTSQEEFFDKEKFTELIIQECIEVAYKVYFANPTTVRGRQIEEKIREHFGVKE